MVLDTEGVDKATNASAIAIGAIEESYAITPTT